MTVLVHPDLNRPALGRGGSLGRLYNVRNDCILTQSLLKNAPPATAIEALQTNRTQYELALKDTLQEKLSKLDISREVSASFLGGLFKVSGSGKYLFTTKTSARVQQASAICNVTTAHERLVLGSVELKDALDLDAFNNTDATHVITGIHLGGTSVVTVNSASSGSEHQTNDGAELTDAGTIAKALLSAKGGEEWDKKTKEQASSFEFTVNSDIIVDGTLPTDFEGVVKFIQAIPEALKSSHNGKGVPLRYDLVPIKDLAKKYDVQIREDSVIATVNQDCLSQFIELFQNISDARQQLNDYLEDVRKHPLCVLKVQVTKADRQVSLAQRMENALKYEFSKTLVAVRQGDLDKSELWTLLYDYNSDQMGLESQRSILSEYREKMTFADAISAQGVKYMTESPNDLDELIMTTDGDLFVFYFNEATRTGPDWRDNHSMLLDLIQNKDSSYTVVVVDCDIYSSNARKLDKPLIEKIRDGKVIIPDVVADMQELADRSLLRCDRPANINRSKKIVPPPGRRLVKVECPGEGCSVSGKLEWTCPTCRDVVCYGHMLASGRLDDYLYCSCGRYSPSNAEFRCKNSVHGVKYTKYDKTYELQGLLKALDPSQEYNILILGETGVGKSTFINAFLNYMLFDSLDDAMAAEGHLHYLIPISFSYQERDGESSTDYFVKVGEESDLEKLPGTGQSATQRTMTHVFSLKGKRSRSRLREREGYSIDFGVGQQTQHRPFSPQAKYRLIDQHLRFLHDGTSLPPPSRHVKKIVFGFTNSRGSNFALGDTKVPLETLLKKKKTGINLGYSNTFFFDAESFRFLALYKQEKKQMTGKSGFDTSWTKSANEAQRLIKETLKLPMHNVKETLRMNRTRLLITNMTKPMVQTSLAVLRTKEDLERQKHMLKHLDADEKNLAKKLILTYTVPVRINLEHPKTVCADESCSIIESDEQTGDKVKIYSRPCHYSCYIKTPDEIIGHAELTRCNAFNNSGNDCTECGHEWKKHLHVSYDIKMEKREMKDSSIVDKIKSNEDAKNTIFRQILKLEMVKGEIETEERAVKNALAEFGVYLSHNAMIAYNDATIGYLDYLIEDARRKGNQEDVHRLQDQQRAYQTQLKHLKMAINSGKSSVPDESSLETIIDQLYAMKHYGSELKKVMPRDPVVAPRTRAPVSVPLRPKGKSKKRWLSWLF